MAHLNGYGTKPDIRTAVKYLQLAAQNQNIRAILKLADMQAGGRGIPRSCQGELGQYRGIEKGRIIEIRRLRCL